MGYKIDKNKSKKINKLNKILIAGGLAIALSGQGYFAINMFSQLEGIKQNDTIIEKVIVQDKENTLKNDIQMEQTVEPEYTPKYDINALQAEYPNAWGIIEKPNGNAFPIAITNSDEEENYYLKHTLDGTYSTSGCLFLDSQNDKNMQNQVSRIWGHNLLAENMFGDLTEYQNQGQTFYDQNKTYTLYTKNGVYKLEVFAALEEDGTLQEFDYQNQEDFLKDMQNNKNSSNFISDVNLEPENKIIVLACCTDRGSAISGNNRFFVYTKVTPVYEYNLNNKKTL